jgi:hypothetical protein
LLHFPHPSFALVDARETEASKSKCQFIGVVALAMSEQQPLLYSNPDEVYSQGLDPTRMRKQQAKIERSHVQDVMAVNTHRLGTEVPEEFVIPDWRRYLVCTRFRSISIALGFAFRFVMNL